MLGKNTSQKKKQYLLKHFPPKKNMLYVSAEEFLSGTQMESGVSTDSTVPASFGLPVNATLPQKWFPSLQGDHLRRWSLAWHVYSVQLKNFYSFYMFDIAGGKKQLKSRFGTWHSHSGNWFLRAFWSSQSLKKLLHKFSMAQSSRKTNDVIQTARDKSPKLAFPTTRPTLSVENKWSAPPFPILHLTSNLCLTSWNIHQLLVVYVYIYMFFLFTVTV